MGDVIHTLPAAATLKHGFPGCEVTWVIAPKWAPLLEGNAFVDRILVFDRTSLGSILRTRAELRSRPYDFAVDFQGLIQSALIASAARPERIYGYHRSTVRERPAALFYSNAISPAALHIVDRHLELARAAGGATAVHAFPIPQGAPEGRLPSGDFVLASPLAGWGSKQWPVDFYRRLAVRVQSEIGVPLVVNGPPGSEASLAQIREAAPHVSGVAGLIDATRRAMAVVGVDSGPLHLAAALGKPGVALFGPTDPERNGPHGGTLTVLRSPRAVTTYKRRGGLDVSMRDLGPDTVFDALAARLPRAASTARR